MRKHLKRVWANRPFVIDGILSGAVLVLCLAQTALHFASPATYFATGPRVSAFSSVTLALAGVAAMAAGMGGVVLVFALSTNSPSFTQLRQQVGQSLKRSVLGPIVSSFVSAALSLAAGLLLTTPLSGWSFWLTLVATLLLTHGASRMLWLLARLIDIVIGEDVRRAQEERRDATTSVIRQRMTPASESEKELEPDLDERRHEDRLPGSL